MTEAEKAVILKLLSFQYNHKGYGNYRCSSCGAEAQVDDRGGMERREPCSPNCPWQQARMLVGL